MSVRPLQSNLAILGHCGYDVYLDEAGVYLRPGGSAYNLACGVAAVRGDADVVMSIGRSVHPRWMEKFRKGGVRLSATEVREGQDTAFVFDLRRDRTEPDIVEFSLGDGSRPPIASLLGNPVASRHVHMGTLPPREARQILEEVVRERPSTTISMTLYEPYLRTDLHECLQLVSLASVVFINETEAQYLNDIGKLHDVFSNRLVVMTAASDGAMLIADEVPVFSYRPNERAVKSPVGAGDVLAGAFLGQVLRGVEPSLALAGACEVAALTVEDYGVERSLLYRAKREADHSTDLLASNTPTLNIVPAGNGFETTRTARSHVQDSTGVFVMRQGKLLLASKPDEKAFVPKRSYVPGGKLQNGETPEEAARRELEEETRLTGGSWRLIGVFTYPDPNDSDRLFRFWQYLVVEPEGIETPHDDITQVWWADPTEIDRSHVFDLTWGQLFLGRLFGITPLSRA